MKERRIPSSRKVEAKAETANHLAASSNYVAGKCPVCSRDMLVTSLKQDGNRPVHVCLEHRVCLPLKRD